LKRLWLLGILLVIGCGDWRKMGLAERGRRVYVANCTICHNLDPTRDGTVGPALAGSSRDLIQARVLRTEYPPGYEPKRGTRQMQPLPFLASDIDALAAYLSPLGPSIE
jgi:mono/diheme cytochrome c family protein